MEDPMKKLSLSLADLKVHSFETDAARGQAGTVHGAAPTPYAGCQSNYWTCGIWCPETTDPQATGPCQCPAPTAAPAC
jgi:hypothetical protein